MESVRAGYGSEHRYHAQTQQYCMHSVQQNKGARVVPHSTLVELPMQKQRFQDKKGERKNRPNQGHQVHPPERKVLIPRPRIEKIDHQETTNTGSERYPARLPGEAPFESFELREAGTSVAVLSQRRDQDGCYKGDAADPEHDTEDMDRARDREEFVVIQMQYPRSILSCARGCMTKMPLQLHKCREVPQHVHEQRRIQRTRRQARVD